MQFCFSFVRIHFCSFFYFRRSFNFMNLGARWPGDVAFGLPFSEMKTGLAALDTIPSGGVYQIICFIGLGELGFSTIKDELEDFCSNKYPNLATEKRMAIELNNGRAAQMGILALMVHEKLNNDPYIINSLLGSPGSKCFSNSYMLKFVSIFFPYLLPSSQSHSMFDDHCKNCSKHRLL